MIASRNFHHGQAFYTAYNEYGVGFRRAGENIAAGQKTVKEVVNGWINSPGHRANILNPQFKNLGVGMAVDEDGQRYWVHCQNHQNRTRTLNYEKRYSGMEADKSKRKKKRSLLPKTATYGVDYDETFAFIAGYTSGGVPYGITWEEENGGSDNTNEWDSEGAFKNKDSVDDDIPF